MPQFHRKITRKIKTTVTGSSRNKKGNCGRPTVNSLDCPSLHFATENDRFEFDLNKNLQYGKVFRTPPGQIWGADLPLLGH